ncbi:hypothetical protein BDV97DRAFT_352047 [Delphinella strobiligena]|nr:hypothetical protein BDV97DRAFT_352047 [Delphinella strobiligena]
MPTIREEEGVQLEDTQLGEFFDFNGAAIEPRTDRPTSQDSELRNSGPPNDPVTYGAEDYVRFEDWIPRFVKPDEPCGYCRDRHLQCYLSYGKLTCTACDTLFRECSFAKVANLDNNADDVPSDVWILDTLHTVTEDACQEQGALTGTRALKSRLGAPNDKKTNPRFSRAAVKILKDWIETHQDKPYPTEDEKTELGKLTGLRCSQISTWLANARRRGKADRGRPKGAASTIRQSSPIGIPSSGIEVMNWENMNPLERWKHSPPVNEPAPMNAIRDALDKNELPSLAESSPSTLGYTGLGSSRQESGSQSKSNTRAPSMTSLEQLSEGSSAAWSGSHDSFGSFSSFGSGLNGKRDRRRRRRGAHAVLKNKVDDKTKRPFQCTFCADSFKSKYDWTRHEKTLHLSLEKFICCPLGPHTIDSSTGNKLCAYCLASNPSNDHLETHGHQTCVEKGREARTFYRKDHLRQHLRLMHDIQLLPHMEAWKVEAKFINSRCGFCTQRFTVWQDRVDHIAAHFKDGRTMIEWKGCRGLDPGVAAHVLNAMPPYLIGVEQNSPNPFSATSPKRCMTVSNHIQNGGPPATCWEILTVRLGRFAKEQASKGVLLTDELLQSQARLILYDDPDPWNQTAADNPEWLDLFKRAHGLDYIPNAVGGQGPNVPEDLEMYGDLGVRIPFSIQLKQGVTDDIPPMAEEHFKQARERRAALQQEASNQTPDTAPVHKAQPYSALAIPAERAKDFETVTGPYPASGVRGQVYYTRDTSSVTNNAFARADIIYQEGQCSSDPSASTSRSTSTSNLLCQNQPNAIPISSSLDFLGYHTSECLLSGLGVGAGRLPENLSDPVQATFPGSAPTTHHQSHQEDTAQQELNTLNATLAAAAATTSPCCEMRQCTHKNEILAHLGFGPPTADYSDIPGPTEQRAGIDSTIDHIPLTIKDAYMRGSGTNMSITPLDTAGDVTMNEAGFDFENLNFDDMNFGSGDVGFDLFDPSSEQFRSGF